MENQPNLPESEKKYQLYRDFQEIEKNKIIISEQLENVDWESELRFERNSISFSSELLINKVDRLINFWAPLQKISNKTKKVLKHALDDQRYHQIHRNKEQASQKKCIV